MTCIALLFAIGCDFSDVPPANGPTPPPIGDDCETLGCASGFYCGWIDINSFEKMCFPKGGEGDDCFIDDEDNFQYAPCAAGLACLNGSCTDPGALNPPTPAEMAEPLARAKCERTRDAGSCVDEIWGEPTCSTANFNMAACIARQQYANDFRGLSVSTLTEINAFIPGCAQEIRNLTCSDLEYDSVALPTGNCADFYVPSDYPGPEFSDPDNLTACESIFWLL